MAAHAALNGLRPDLRLIADLVEPNTRVLDVGCGDGSLLQLLADTKAVDGRGVEVERERVNACVARGLSVIQGDADSDLADYPDGAFDYAILSLTIQATLRPKEVLEQLLRIGRHAIVSFPNFGHWQVRARLLLDGRMPVTANLPEAWYVTPNVHLCTIKDFAGGAAPALLDQREQCFNHVHAQLMLHRRIYFDRQEFRLICLRCRQPDIRPDAGLAFPAVFCRQIAGCHAWTKLFDSGFELAHPAATDKIIALADKSRPSLDLKGRADDLCFFFHRLSLDTQKYRSKGR